MLSPSDGQAKVAENGKVSAVAVSVLLPSGDAFDIHVSTKDSVTVSVRAIKAAIRSVHGSPVRYQQLFLRGEPAPCGFRNT